MAMKVEWLVFFWTDDGWSYDGDLTEDEALERAQELALRYPEEPVEIFRLVRWVRVLPGDLVVEEVE